jgi:hypothetical protein
MEDCMPSLQVCDIPDELYERIALTARVENRSAAQQTIVLLKDSPAAQRIARRKSVLKEIDELDIKNTDSFPDPAKLTREDR